MPTDIDIINKHLKEHFGAFFDGRAWFRMVFSTEQTEKRIGKFSQFYGSIFVREYIGMDEVPKYPSPEYRDRWVLEKLMFITNKELWAETEKGTYEPIWVFRGPGSTYQKPTIKAVDFVMAMLFTPKQKLSEWELAAQDEKNFEKEVEENYGFFEDKYGGKEATALHQREAIVIPTVIGAK